MSKFSAGLFAVVTVLASIASAQASFSQYERGAEAIHSMAGCYLIDYSYTETESLKDGYVRDQRVYDVNKDKSIKELIYMEHISPYRMRLQHILFGTDLHGNLMEGSELRHQAEDWEYNAPFVYDFTKPLNWMVKENQPNMWTRRITNLDDGLRYQCAGAWEMSTAYPEWTCSNYAPIPGRETRDMGRKDYNTLERTTRIVAYGNSWLERQMNTKVIDTDGARTPLAKELGKNWYVRLPDSECDVVQGFVDGRKQFWSLMREVWDQVLDGKGAFIEKELAGQPKRYAKMMELEAEYASKMNEPGTKAAVKTKMIELIKAYRQ
ncbi:MAG TPA: DUF6607 family protein [Bdellovibrionales bacterium]|nr:DUF6607 family protein [Bdellovibrionales bacterium]